MADPTVLALVRPYERAAVDLWRQRDILHSAVDSVICNHVYELDGHRPMVSLDLDVAEEMAATMERVSRLLSQLEGANADTLDSFARKWARVKARVKGGWDTEFVRKIDACLVRPGWKPSARQAETIESLLRVYDANTPEYREEMVTRAGVKLVWLGQSGAGFGGDGWCEVLE